MKRNEFRGRYGFDRHYEACSATHLISDVEQVLDEVIFLQNGSVVRQGNVDDLRVESGLSIDELFRSDFRA